MLNKNVFGYFIWNNENPTHDPWLNTYCLFCMDTLSKPIKTISLLWNNDNISYFYRCHKECYENKSEEEIMQYESSIIDKTFNS